MLTAAAVPVPAAILQKYWGAGNRKPHRYISPVMIEGAYKKTEAWHEMAARLEQPFDKVSADPKALAKTK